MQLFGGVEAGGTKFVCAVGTGPASAHPRGGGGHRLLWACRSQPPVAHLRLGDLDPQTGLVRR